MTSRTLADIATDIRADWKNVNYGAEPYLQAMSTMHSIADQYGHDTGESIVKYFLVNASTWRGAVAREIKAELKGMLTYK